MAMVLRHWKGVLSRVVRSPSLEMFQEGLDVALEDIW